jgi:hypothetical protein
MNTKKILTIAIFLFLFLPVITWAASFSYTPMEQIPGFATDGNFYNYIAAVYKFGIWGVGVSALLMITIGGYMYISSAANVASVDKSKAVITDAIIGLILALISYLLLYEINPNLVRLDSGTVATIATQPVPITTPTTPTGAPVTDSKCSSMNDAINNNSSGVDPKTLKAIIDGGEGCNKSLSTDGYGSCGYSQALPAIRTACGIPGDATTSCLAIQNDPQLDANCAAWLIKSNNSRCPMTDIQQVASCYNSGKPNNCAKTTDNYCTRVLNSYASL